MSFSDYLETRILQHLLTATSLSRPDTYIGLFTTVPGESGGTEVFGNNYARVQVTAWTVSGNQASNTGAVNFPTASGSWGEIRGLGVFDAPTGGNLLLYAELAAYKTIGAGDIATFGAGQLQATLD